MLCLHVAIITMSCLREAEDQQKSKRIDRAYIIESVPTLSMGMTSCTVCKFLLSQIIVVMHLSRFIHCAQHKNMLDLI